MSFDTILEQIGSHGRYQLLVLAMMNMLKTFTGFETLLPVIVAYQQDHQCSENISALEIPGNGSLVFDKCEIYRNETPSIRIPCSEWTYDESIMRTTIFADFKLACGREYLISLTTTLFFVGFMIGCTAYGIISDRLGRMIGMLLSTFHLFIFSLAVAFAPNIWTFGILRLLAGIGNGGLMATLFTMAAEVTDPDHRAFFGIMSQNGFTFGGLAISLCGYFIKDHFWIQITFALLMLPTVFMPFLIHESPRWLFTTRRIGRADRVVRAIAKINGRSLSEEFDISSFIESDEEDKTRMDGERSLTDNFVALFKTLTMTWTTIIVWSYWFIISIGYFGSYFTLGKIGANIFIDIAIVSIAEVVSRVAVVYAAKWWGRVMTLAVCATLGGLTCLINAAFIQFAILGNAIRILSAVGQFFFNGGFDLIWFYSGEVFPTVIRNAGVGIGSTWARVGGTIAPQAALLFTIWKPAPLLVMGILPIIGGISTLVLPETKDKELPETMADGTRFVKSGFGFFKKLKKSTRNGPTEVAQDILLS